MEIPENKGLMVMGHDRVKMRDFLMILEKSLGLISLACQQAGIDRRTYYNWREKDEWFREISDQVIEEQRPVVNDLAEHGLLSLIREKNVPAIIFYLKTRHPGYKETRNKETENEVNELLKNMQERMTLAKGIDIINKTLEERCFKEEWEKNDRPING
jgi:hypothetical protein